METDPDVAERRLSEEDRPRASSADRRLSEASPLNPCHILIVDDEAIDAMDINERLAAMGYSVAGRTTTGEKALASVEKERPDLVLIDIGLRGDMDGIAAAAEMHRRFHLPVIFLIADPEVATLDRAGLAEPFGYILKPFDDQEIKSVIEIALCKHQAEEALRESEEQYRTVTEHSMDGITIVKDNVLAYVNRRLSAMFGHDGPEELVGQSPLTLVHPDDAEEVEKRAQARLSGADVQPRHLFRGVTRDGRMLYIELSATLIAYRGGPATLAYHRDVTGRKKLEDQLRQAQKLEGIGQLAGGIAHDFNNLLTVISGFATILRMGLKENETQKAYVDQILSASEKAANLTEGLLAFSRKQAINPKPSNLNELVKRARKFLSRIIGEDIELRTTLIDRELIAMIDENQLDHVILNMAANARDAMPEGGLLSIDTGEAVMDDQFINTHGYGKPGLYAFISVSDSGVGMDGETKGKVFEPFFTTKGMGRGTGLGLSMVYGIVKQHNGYISVESEVAKGTTFTIYLPRTQPGTAEASQTAPAPLPGGTETILLVEDEADVRAYVKLVLQKYGYRVIETRDGEDALEQFARCKDSVDLCILDVVMPKMNGKEVYVRLKALKPDVPVFFISGYADDVLKQKGFEGDEFKIVTKPIRLTQFLTRIREALDASVAPVREGDARQ